MAYERNYSRDRDDRWRERDRDFGRGRGSYDRGSDDRGFFDRAGDEVRSWFGDDEAERRRDLDARRYDAEQAFGGRRERDRDRDRDDDRDDRSRADYGRGTASGWGNQRGWSDDRFGGFETPRNRDRGFEGDVDRSQRFDRGEIRGHDLHDRHYSEWRHQQISNLDRDYDEYRREHQSRFEQEFGSWRDKRQGQRQHLGRVTEHMEVVGSDGQHVGKVDHVRGDRIILAKNDEAAGGRHHSIPCSWIENVTDKVSINKTAEEATRAWKDEERSRALFEREDQGSDGPHVLDRSFAGTYGKNR